MLPSRDKNTYICRYLLMIWLFNRSNLNEAKHGSKCIYMLINLFNYKCRWEQVGPCGTPWPSCCPFLCSPLSVSVSRRGLRGPRHSRRQAALCVLHKTPKYAGTGFHNYSAGKASCVSACRRGHWRKGRTHRQERTYPQVGHHVCPPRDAKIRMPVCSRSVCPPIVIMRDMGSNTLEQIGKPMYFIVRSKSYSCRCMTKWCTDYMFV